jgi:hypothetical protein
MRGGEEEKRRRGGEEEERVIKYIFNSLYLCPALMSQMSVG